MAHVRHEPRETPKSRVAVDPDRYRRLPEPIRLEDTVEVKETVDAPDPNGGRNTDQDFLLRYAGW